MATSLELNKHITHIGNHAKNKCSQVILCPRRVSRIFVITYAQSKDWKANFILSCRWEQENIITQNIIVKIR